MAARSRGVVTTAAKLMGLNDANVAGRGHGGILLRLMTDEAGFVAALRFLNGGPAPWQPRAAAPVGGLSLPTPPVFNAALATIAKTSFLKPVDVGDLVEAHAEVTFATESAVWVHISLFAENLFTGERRLTNTTHAGYVAVDCDKPVDGLLRPLRGVPALQPPAPTDAGQMAEMRAAEAIHQNQVNARQCDGKTQESLLASFNDSSHWTSSLSHMLMPTDCFVNGVAQGGVVTKLMDEVGAIAAFRHCRTNCVTASFETLRFRRTLRRGDVVSVLARPSFASGKSLEIEILVRGENLLTGETTIAAHGHFVFVSLDETGKALPVPSLSVPPSEAAQLRYLARKRAPR